MELPESFRTPARVIMKNLFPQHFFGEIPPSCLKCQKWTKAFFTKLLIIFSKQLFSFVGYI